MTEQILARDIMISASILAIIIPAGFGLGLLLFVKPIRSVWSDIVTWLIGIRWEVRGK